jgi:hypothetical protein
MSSGRKGERLGWVLGWAGAFLWVFILATVNLASGPSLPSLLGFALVAAAVACILVLSPWRNPSQRYWKLMLPLYALFLLSVAWASWTAGGPAELGLSVWSLFLLLPLLLPIHLAGNRRWIDGEPQA